MKTSKMKMGSANKKVMPPPEKQASGYKKKRSVKPPKVSKMK